jgi:hypothetical protein
MNYALKIHLANSPMTIAKEEILDIHMLVLSSVGISSKDK